MAIWVIITSSIIRQNYEQRKGEYINGIKSFIDMFKDPKYKIVIVENATKMATPFARFQQTFLNQFGIPVLYTRNNILMTKTINYGIPELLDIFECIKYFNIQDEDFVIKATGRYIIDKNSPFFQVVDNLERKPYSAVVRFNQFDKPVSLTKTNNCVTGLIGLKCKYLKQIELPGLELDIDMSTEMKWAKVINTIEDSEVCCLEELGLFIKPMIIWNKNYFVRI